MAGFLFRAALSMVGLWIATRWISGIRIDDAQTLVLAGVVLGVVNAIVRPIAVILTFPLTLLSLGLFLLVVNAGMLGLTAWLLPGFHLSGFMAALLASLLVSLTGWIGSMFIGSRGRFEVYTHRGR
ncbi:MAG TPA: phage holin family protein [Steroidobacteraceae bacterium]|jgi:putative membrane protein|nr:phage holin family protein [Steroidobacteraceae bacterium]